MARARNIKPSFFDNDDLAMQNDPLGRLLFIGLWTLADFNGNVEWRSQRIKVKLLPYDECDVEKLAINLDKSGFVRFYSDGEKIYLNIPNFTVHQNPHKNERDKGAAVPEYSEERRQLIDISTITINRDKSRANPDQNGTDPADSLFPLPESSSLNPDCGSPKSEDPPPAGDEGAGKPPKSKLTKTDLINDFGIPEELAVQFLQIRKDKRLTLTPIAMSDLVGEFEKAGMTVQEGIAFCCRESWAAFKNSWNWRERIAQNGPPQSFTETDYSKGVTADGRLS